MIEYRASDANVKIVVDSGIGKFTFIHECGQDYLASLMRDQYERHMQSEIKKIREQSYNQGWKDAKAKVAKERLFSGRW